MFSYLWPQYDQNWPVKHKSMTITTMFKNRLYHHWKRYQYTLDSILTTPATFSIEYNYIEVLLAQSSIGPMRPNIYIWRRQEWNNHLTGRVPIQRCIHYITYIIIYYPPTLFIMEYVSHQEVSYNFWPVRLVFHWKLMSAFLWSETSLLYDWLKHLLACAYNKSNEHSSSY